LLNKLIFATTYIFIVAVYEKTLYCTVYTSTALTFHLFSTLLFVSQVYINNYYKSISIAT